MNAWISVSDVATDDQSLKRAKLSGRTMETCDFTTKQLIRYKVSGSACDERTNVVFGKHEIV